MCLFINCFKRTPKKSQDKSIELTKTNDPIDKLNMYSKLKKIGYGATSRIYITKKNNKTYVCKCVSRDSLKKGFREIKVLQKLNSDFFPKLHEFISFDSNLFIFMNYENSVDVHKYCFEINKCELPYKNIIHIIREMGKAIQTLHSYNFVHLDLKLENFIITNKKNIKLIDFGTARPLLKGERILHNIVGTKNYSAPEIYRSKYHLNSDIWSYAVCIWILIVKDYCFNHNSIDRCYTVETLPYDLFTFPSEYHLLMLKKFNTEIKELFKNVFKVFPIDRPSIQFLINFNYEKYLISNK